MIVVVFGGRVYADEARLFSMMDRFHAKYPVTMVIEGDAEGADRMAGRWAASRGVHCAVVRALWDTHGRAAGPLRNRAMLTLKPDAGIAFPGGKGTADMEKACESAGVRVWKIDACS